MGTGQGLANASKLLIQLILKDALLVGVHRSFPEWHEDKKKVSLLVHYFLFNRILE